MDMVGAFVAGMEAFAMARDLFVEPQSQILGRLVDGVLSNVVFEYALTGAEQAVLAQLLSRVRPEAFQALGLRLRDCPSQEAEIRSFITPLCEAIRQM